MGNISDELPQQGQGLPVEMVELFEGVAGIGSINFDERTVDIVFSNGEMRVVWFRIEGDDPVVDYHAREARKAEVAFRLVKRAAEQIRAISEVQDRLDQDEAVQADPPSSKSSDAIYQAALDYVDVVNQMNNPFNREYVLEGLLNALWDEELDLSLKAMAGNLNGGDL